MILHIYVYIIHSLLSLAPTHQFPWILRFTNGYRTVGRLWQEFHIVSTALVHDTQSQFHGHEQTLSMPCHGQLTFVYPSGASSSFWAWWKIADLWAKHLRIVMDWLLANFALDPCRLGLGSVEMRYYKSCVSAFRIITDCRTFCCAPSSSKPRLTCWVYARHPNASLMMMQPFHM